MKDSPFKDLRIMVLGEVCIDKYVEGISTRQSPECDVPVVTNLKTRIKRLGMTGNVMMNLRALGAKAEVFSITGNDAAAQCIGLRCNLIKVEGRKTCVKKRMICNGQQFARFDRETTTQISDEAQTAYYLKVAAQMDDFDAIIIQDYGKGLWSTYLLGLLIAFANASSKKVFVDPWGGRPITDYRGAYLVKPNRNEALKLTGTAENVETYSDTDLLKKLEAQIPLTTLVITRGAAGMIAGHNGDWYFSFAKQVEAVDVCGAGDTALAVLTLMMLKEDNIRKAMDLANKAAGLVVQKKGPATVTWGEICDKK